MPTNGVGLGHAQRCALIASALGPRGRRPVFAAFPSCMRMVKSYGFDVMPLIGRSQPARTEPTSTISATTSGCGRSPPGARTLVFDGGYVFDSVYRTVLEGGVRGVWIRRGLWQSGQDNSVALDREKAFDRVIVPSEAFDELNAAYSRGDHVCTRSGPVVQEVALSPDAREELRARLAERYERPLRSARRLAARRRGRGRPQHANPGALRPLRAPIRHAASRARLAERDAGAELVRLAQLPGRAHPARGRARRRRGPRRHRRRL